jgi:hypothetical protein
MSRSRSQWMRCHLPGIVSIGLGLIATAWRRVAFWGRGDPRLRPIWREVPRSRNCLRSVTWLATAG